VEKDPSDSIPLISQEFSDELFAPEDDPETTAMQRDIWLPIRSGLESELKALEGLGSGEMKAHLHRIRGYVSSASLLRLGAILLAWEDEPSRSDYFLPLALGTSRASILEVERRFPHLVRGVESAG